MINDFDFQYALENTKVVLPPERRLETFGASVLSYYLITEDMDSLNLSHVREGQIIAEKPQLITPQSISRLMLEGFGEHAEKFADAISQNAHRFAILKYGFLVKKNDYRHYEIHEPFSHVVDRVIRDVKDKNEPMSAVLTGVDEGWEVGLLKYMFDMIQSSGQQNINDFKDRGLLP